jgi:hypothetical protein
VNPFLNALVAAFALFMLIRHGRRGLLFAWPRLVRVTGEERPSTVAQLRAASELESLGFRRIGSKQERGLGGGLDLQSEVYVNRAAGTFADVYAHQPPGVPTAMVTFLSPFPDGALVLTANHPRVPILSDKGLVGGLPLTDIDGTWGAHQKAIDHFTPKHGTPEVQEDLANRLEVARAWYRGIGGRELRKLFTVNFFNALIAVLLLAGTVEVVLKRR